MNSSFDRISNVLKPAAAVLLCCSFSWCNLLIAADSLSSPILGPEIHFNEVNGRVAVEAEHFFQQDQTETRAFFLTTPQTTPDISPDGDPAHISDASNGAYLEILPDSRRSHDDELQPGINFSNKPGQLAIVSYRVNIQTPGRYYVWVRAHSTNSEDNGIHVGINGTWPQSGRRMQWCEGKQTWRWESKQRTKDEHCGVDHQIYLDIEKPGVHTVQFSMREDGFEFDKWLMTLDRDFQRPTDQGPVSTSNAERLPTFSPVAAVTQSSASKTNDDQPTATTLAAGQAPISNQKSNSTIVLDAKQFALKGTQYYLDQKKWIGINPNDYKTASVSKSLSLPAGTYSVTLQTVGENDGSSTFEVAIDSTKLGTFVCPLATETFETGERYNVKWDAVTIKSDSAITISSTIASADGKEYSRARWQAVVLEPADEVTRIALANRSQTDAGKEKRDKKSGAGKVSKKSKIKVADRDRSTSPTQPISDAPLMQPRKPDGDGSVTITGQQKKWHKVVVSMQGPFAHEYDNVPNPFLDYRMETEFKHTDGTTYVVPGYFAADGNASETSAKSGTTWRTNFCPDRTGTWHYSTTIVKGDLAAIEKPAAVEKLFAVSGQFEIADSDKPENDFRSQGRLQYVGKRYLQHMDSGKYFLKAGADSPETLLAFADFDDTIAPKKKVPLKTYSRHLSDWRQGDPLWQGDKGKGLIGAINYLSGKGCNAFSFLTYNAGGDGDNVWPFVHRDDKLHYDCSKLDQWAIVLDHGTAKGMYLHFKLQETENDDHRRGHKRKDAWLPTCLDGGNLGIQRKLYIREIVARFGHSLALNWNLGEENTQTTQQQIDMIDYIGQTDPYGHHIVIHTYPDLQDEIYGKLIGDQSQLTGTSLQNSDIKDTHHQTVKWVRASAAAGKPWVVAFDESGSAQHGQCPDLGYEGFDGTDLDGNKAYDQHAVRRQTLWANIMGGGAGLEYYFGYKFVQNDLQCEDWRSRDQSWDYCRICLEFFKDKDIPFHEMSPSDELIGNAKFNNDKYCLSKSGEIYLIYLPTAGSTELDLSGVDGDFNVSWFNPRTGKDLPAEGAATTQLTGGGTVSVASGITDGQDVVAIVVRK
jgi:hypothetical protein